MRCERRHGFNSEYLETQKAVDEKMRAILVDWLQDVSVHFEVRDETLHYAIAFLNLVLSGMEVKKKNLQLVGVVCMKIAEYDLFSYF